MKHTGGVRVLENVYYWFFQQDCYNDSMTIFNSLLLSNLWQPCYKRTRLYQSFLDYLVTSLIYPPSFYKLQIIPNVLTTCYKLWYFNVCVCVCVYINKLVFYFLKQIVILHVINSCQYIFRLLVIHLEKPQRRSLYFLYLPYSKIGLIYSHICLGYF